MTSLTSSTHSTGFPSSDSENYSTSPDDRQSALSPEQESPPPSSSSSPLILYSPPTFWSILRGAGINLLLPFVNGLMLGFGELVAHEWAWRLGWGGTKIFPNHRNGGDSKTVGPGVVMRDDPIERRRRDGEELDGYTSME
ncbi:hypothetical protein LTR37_005867 [Vermiconidia calcicola]|uniref:Uncharacterized protein n=1 Tax=Vermiconidia calcicola TaxID=1690605 RepID=A0ACC3NIK2_9PEZI|nr:hypothetical protein LTR37_005867 [Vermiconidia calcicola]